MRKLTTAALLAVVVSAAHSQTVASLEFVGQPTMNTNQGRVSGCGIRFLGTHAFEQDAKGQRATIVDGSISLFATGSAVKGGQYRATTDAAGKYASTPILSQLQWLRVGDGPPLDRTQGTAIPADDPGFSMFTASAAGGADAMIAVLGGVKLRVSFADKSQRTSIFSGTVQMKEQDKSEFLACVETLLQDAKEAGR